MTRAAHRDPTLLSSERAGRPRLLPRTALAAVVVGAVVVVAALPFVAAAAGRAMGSPAVFPLGLLAAVAAAVALRQFVATLVLATRDGVMFDGHVYGWDDIAQASTLDVAGHGHALLFVASDGSWTVTATDTPERLHDALTQVRDGRSAGRSVAPLRRRVALVQWSPAAAAFAAVVLSSVWQTSL